MGRVYTMRVAVVLAAIGLVAARPPCTGTGPLVADGRPLHRPVTGWHHKSLGKHLRFQVVGDFGVDVPANVDAGDWKDDFDVVRRNQVAQAMKKAAAEEIVDFAINVGDSFYQSGVHNTTDHRWKSTWESVFTAPDRYWYSVLGNHDWYGNERFNDDSGTLAQINYTVAGLGDNRWCMPDFNYSFDTHDGDGPMGLGDGPTVRFVFIDTMTLLPSDGGGCAHPDDPSRFDVSKPMCEGKAAPSPAEMKAYLEKEVCSQKPSKGWTVVVGHHPVVSAGPQLRTSDPRFTAAYIDALDVSAEVKAELKEYFQYDPAQRYRRGTMEPVLLDVLLKCKVDLYISGHEHMTSVMTHTTQKHTLTHVTYGDSGKANLIQELTQEPTASACRVTGQCFAEHAVVKQAWGQAWDIHFKDHSGAFGEVEVHGDRLIVRTITKDGVAANTHAVYRRGQEPSPAKTVAAPDRAGEGGRTKVMFLTLALLVMTVSVALNSRAMGPGRSPQVH